MKTNGSGRITISVVDDHTLFRSGLVNLIKSFGEKYQVVSTYNNGRELLDHFVLNDAAQLIILDMNMPELNGYETTVELKKLKSETKILILTMVEDEQLLIKMLRCGVGGYLSKDVEPAELKLAIDAIVNEGYYYPKHITGKLINALNTPLNEASENSQLTERELTFLQYACSEYTYKEIADKMFLSVKTIDGYRNALFEKLQVKSRVGLVLFAVRHNLVKIK